MVREIKIIFKNQSSHISDMLYCWGQNTSEKVSNGEVDTESGTSTKTEKEHRKIKVIFFFSSLHLYLPLLTPPQYSLPPSDIISTHIIFFSNPMLEPVF